MRRSRRCVNGERKTSAVCNCHELRTFAPLGLSHSEPPFLATTNIPSMKHSVRSSSPRTRRSSASASNTLRKTPSRTHCWNRRWQVWYGGNRPGKSSRIWVIAEGRFFTKQENDSRDEVCVIRASVAEQFFRFGPAIEKAISIGWREFRVIGVMEKREQLFGGGEGT